MSFHVPELARVRRGRLGSDFTYGNNGAFDLESPEPGWRLALICSDATDPDVPESDGWEHVSIHAYKGKDGPTLQMRTPTWKEMAYVKRLCWDGGDVVVQYHPRESEYVNCHPHVLHLWRSRTHVFPTPPSILVGPLAVPLQSPPIAQDCAATDAPSGCGGEREEPTRDALPLDAFDHDVTGGRV